MGLLRSGCGRNSGFSVRRTDDDLRLRPFMGGSRPEAPDGSEVGNCRLTMAWGDAWDRVSVAVCVFSRAEVVRMRGRERKGVWRVEGTVCDFR